MNDVSIVLKEDLFAMLDYAGIENVLELISFLAIHLERPVNITAAAQLYDQVAITIEPADRSKRFVYSNSIHVNALYDEHGRQFFADITLETIARGKQNLDTAEVNM